MEVTPINITHLGYAPPCGYQLAETRWMSLTRYDEVKAEGSVKSGEVKCLVISCDIFFHIPTDGSDCY